MVIWRVPYEPSRIFKVDCPRCGTELSPEDFIGTTSKKRRTYDRQGRWFDVHAKTVSDTWVYHCPKCGHFVQAMHSVKTESCPDVAIKYDF